MNRRVIRPYKILAVSVSLLALPACSKASSHRSGPSPDPSLSPVAAPSQQSVPARYQPLCDPEGYPVVGNVTFKSAGVAPCATGERHPDEPGLEPGVAQR